MLLFENKIYRENNERRSNAICVTEERETATMIERITRLVGHDELRIVNKRKRCP